MARRRCVFSPRARRDLNDIINYIAKHDPESAIALVERLESTCRRFVRFPELGRKRDEIKQGIRSFPVDRYAIFYRITDVGVEIVRVLHGRRDIESVLSDE